MGVAGIDMHASREQVAYILGHGFGIKYEGDITIVTCPRYDNDTLAAVLRNGVPTGLLLP